MKERYNRKLRVPLRWGTDTCGVCGATSQRVRRWRQEAQAMGAWVGVGRHGLLTGAISSANHPSEIAFSARCWDVAANASCAHQIHGV